MDRFLEVSFTHWLVQAVLHTLFMRELWARVNQPSLFKIKIYLKGVHKWILFVFLPSAVNDIPRRFYMNYHCALLACDPPRERTEVVKPTHGLSLQTTNLSFLWEDLLSIPGSLLIDSSEICSKIGCLEPVVSTWRALVRACVGPWCLRTACRETQQTSPSLSSTPLWWACFWSLTTRCAKHNIT